MEALFRVMPDPDVLVALSPEELAGRILPILPRADSFNVYNLINELRDPRPGQNYPRQNSQEVAQAIQEAFAWLDSQALIIPKPFSIQDEWKVLSRRARAIQDENGFQEFRASQRLEKDILHPRIADTTWNAFIRGQFDVAVFQAMKEVEISVREASGLTDLLGVPLMHAAFHPEHGPLADRSAQGGERVARSALFAGAIGSYKNPHSHRDVPIETADEALETIMLANHLLRIVDARVAENQPKLTKN